MALESKFQAELIKEIKDLFPGCIVLKNDAGYIQGIPDLLLLYQGTWAALECKRTATSQCRPNQKYYVELLNSMSYASFIFPENREEVLDEIQSAFRFRR